MHQGTWKEDYASSREEDILKGLEGKRNALHLGCRPSGYEQGGQACFLLVLYHKCTGRTVCTHQPPPHGTEVTCWLISNSSVLIPPAQTSHRFLLLPQTASYPFFYSTQLNQLLLPFTHTLSSTKLQSGLPGKSLVSFKKHMGGGGGGGGAGMKVTRRSPLDCSVRLWFGDFYLLYLCMLNAELNKCWLLLGQLEGPLRSWS